jgi:glycosyltransferase involved in cell wall biosynthesis
MFFFFRKGIDLVAQILPVICKKRFHHGREQFKVNFIIAGDGPKRIVLEEVIEKNKLQKRYSRRIVVDLCRLLKSLEFLALAYTGIL